MDSENINRISERKVSEDSYGNQNLTIVKASLENIGLKAEDKAKVIATDDEIIIRRLDDG